MSVDSIQPPQSNMDAERRAAPEASETNIFSKISIRNSAIGLAFLAQFIFFSLLALRRLIDSDEGFYLYISKLVVSHWMLLYRDLFYQQMPLLPYAYGAWMRVFGFTWEAGRIFSAALAALTGMLLFHEIRRTTKSMVLAAVSVFLYSMNLSVLLFFLTAKTYALSTVLLLGSMLSVTSSKRMHALFLGGILLALSVQTRLFFAAAAAPFAVVVWKRHGSRRWRAICNVSAGFVLGFIPSYIFFFLTPRQFVYDNVFYHAMRDPAGLIGDVEQKLAIARNLMLSADSPRPTQLSFLVLGLPLSLFFWKRLDDTGRLAALTAGALGIISFLPTPAFAQYFCVIVPFLILCLIKGLVGWCEFLPAAKQRVFYAGIAGFLLLFAAASAPRVYMLFWQVRNVPGISAGTEAADWSIARAREIASVVDSCTEFNSPVVCSWPGYLLTSSRMIYPKMENQISMGVSGKLSEKDAAEFMMLREEDLRRAIADPRVQTMVAGNCMLWWQKLYPQLARENGYDLFWKEGNVNIYVRRKPPSDLKRE